MPTGGSSLLGRIRDPEHTGERRCWPCTVVNVAIAAVLSALSTLVAVELAAVVAVVSLAAIALRGYLVPGTPRLTQQYLPERVLRAFGKAPGYTDPDDFEVVQRVEHYRQNAVDADAFLADEGIVAETDDGRELTEAFAAALGERLTARPADADLTGPLASAFGIDAEDVTVDRDPHPAVTVGYRVREWPSWSALRVDVAAHEALAEWTERWADLPLEQRVEMLETVRAHRTVCPACGGPVERASDVQTSCCGVHEVLAVACTDCGERLAELNPRTHAGTIVS